MSWRNELCRRTLLPRRRVLSRRVARYSHAQADFRFSSVSHCLASVRHNHRLVGQLVYDLGLGATEVLTKARRSDEAAGVVEHDAGAAAGGI